MSAVLMFLFGALVGCCVASLVFGCALIERDGKRVQR